MHADPFDFTLLFTKHSLLITNFWHEAAESAMDGSRDLGPGGRRTVTVLRRFYEKVVPRSEERLGICPSSQLQTHSPSMAASGAGRTAAVNGTVTHFHSQPPKDLRLSRGELTVLLRSRPATNTGVH